VPIGVSNCVKSTFAAKTRGSWRTNSPDNGGISRGLTQWGLGCYAGQCMSGGVKLIPQFQKILQEYKATYMAARNLAARSPKEYATDVAQSLGYLQQTGVRKLASVGPRTLKASSQNLMSAAWPESRAGASSLSCGRSSGG